MSITAQVVAELVDAGLRGAALVDALRRIEASAANEFQRNSSGRIERIRAYDRARKKPVSSGIPAEIPVEQKTAVVVDNISSTSQKETRKVRTTTPQSRGHRLPDNFQPLPSILEDARNRGLTDAEYWDEFERWKDYWRGVPGQKGCKLDWQGTWRNRMKEQADRKKVRTNGTASRPSPGQTMRDAIRDVGEHIRGHGKVPGSLP